MKRLRSIFTDDMDTCYITGINRDIERHHIFEGMQGLKDFSEFYNYIVPLHVSVHPNGARCSSKNWVDLDHWLKRKCQEHFIEHHGTREEWYRQVGRFYDDRTDERCWRNTDMENKSGK